MKIKNKNKNNKGEIIIYKTKDGRMTVDVQLQEETIWLNAHQMAKLFDVDRTGIVRHIRNAYKSQELKKNSTCAKIAQVAKDGKVRQMDYYNLDMILSVGYRVNSKRATQFRIWSTGILKEHLLRGFTVNQKLLQQRGVREFEQAIDIIKKTIRSKRLTSRESMGLLKVITEYASSWLLLHSYDEGKLAVAKTTRTRYYLDYEGANQAIDELKVNLIKKKQASSLFGQKKESALQSILGNIHQTFEKKELYPSIEEKAAHLLYFIIKDHPFVDGNKRIGSFLFIVFLANNRFLFKKNGEKKINDNALVALALLIAESSPKQKDVMIKLIINLLQN